MADFVRLWRRRHEVCEELDALLESADSTRDAENMAALRIQRLFRGAFARGVIAEKAAACCQIQRVYRGHLGRVKAGKARSDRQAQQESSIFHYYATAIQRVFNGYYSRKYIHDFFARKAYIESIKQKSQQLREQLSGHMEKQIEEEEDRAEAAAREEFKKVTQGLHHLLSTKSTPGVYNPPYAAGMVPTAFDVPIEDHLREGARELLRTTGLRRVKPASYTEQSRLSVQASSKYGVVQEQARTQRRYNRLRHLSARPFLAGSKPKPKPVKPSMSLGTPYEEPWRIARSTRELANLPSQKAKRVTNAPFHTSVIGNRLFEEYERSGRLLRGGAATVQPRGPRHLAASRGARTTGGLSATKRSVTLASEHTAV